MDHFLFMLVILFQKMWSLPLWFYLPLYFGLDMPAWFILMYFLYLVRHTNSYYGIFPPAFIKLNLRVYFVMLVRKYLAVFLETCSCTTHFSCGVWCPFSCSVSILFSWNLFSYLETICLNHFKSTVYCHENICLTLSILLGGIQFLLCDANSWPPIGNSCISSAKYI